MNYSKQNTLILDVIKNNKTHPNVETIYKEVLKKNDKISLATVYRNLEKLYKSNLITKVVLPNKQERFDGNIEKHYHAVCKDCGEIIDIFIDYFDEIDKLTQEKTGIKIFDHDILFTTICSKCKND